MKPQSQAAKDFIFYSRLQRILRLNEQSDPDHPTAEEAKAARSELIERMAALAKRASKGAGVATHVLALLAVLIVRASHAIAQEIPHQHPTETLTGDVAKFYSTWNRPDNPNLSCCNRADCYATQMRTSGGRIQAKRREDGKWLNIPATKIETGRDSPDGRNHLCAPPPEREHVYRDGVICFIAGAGG